MPSGWPRRWSSCRRCFARDGYDDAIVFGHAKDGNLHFVLTQAFDDPRDVERYDRFMRELADLVAGRHGGALKAEHGTGRNMAPFVDDRVGRRGLRDHARPQALVDPDGLPQPRRDRERRSAGPRAPPEGPAAVEPEVDACIECGFCERICPSRDLTLTPRQRIVVRARWRACARSRRARQRFAASSADYVYDGLDTCAADGLCAPACPVGIDTGALVKRLRHDAHGPAVEEIAVTLATHFAVVEHLARAALFAGHGLGQVLGAERLAAASAWISRRLGRRLPVWDPSLPRAAGRPAPTPACAAGAVLFSSCASRVLAADGDRPLADVIARVSRRGGVPLRVPDDAAGVCCGLAFASKGYARAAAAAADRAIERLWDWSEQGALPVIVDASPCALVLKSVASLLAERNRSRHAALSILDGIEHAAALVAAGLRPAERRRSVVLHPACSVRKMGLTGMLEGVARACADVVVVPPSAGCCGFAGDRGLTFPELSRSALGAEAEEVRQGLHDAWVSSSGTCEIGLRRASDRPFRSFWHLLDAPAGRAADPVLR